MVKGLDDLFTSIKNSAGKTSADDLLSSNSINKSFGDSFSDLGKKADDILPGKINNDIDTIARRATINPKSKLNEIVTTPDEIAKKLGFENEKDFFKYIDQFKPGDDLGKLRKFISLVRSNKDLITVVGVTASVGSILFYAKNYQAANTGCFRYRRTKGGGVRQKSKTKIGGNYCRSVTDNYAAKIDAKKHPLYKMEKWGCNPFSDKNGYILDQSVVNIMDLGCAGLCNVKNYNALARVMNDIGESRYKPIDVEGDRYVYRCEIATMLGAFTGMASDTIDQIISAAINSKLGQRIRNFFDLGNLKFYIFLLVILFLYYKFVCKKNTKTIHETMETSNHKMI